MKKKWKKTNSKLLKDQHDEISYCYHLGYHPIGKCCSCMLSFDINEL